MYVMYNKNIRWSPNHTPCLKASYVLTTVQTELFYGVGKQAKPYHFLKPALEDNCLTNQISCLQWT